MTRVQTNFIAAVLLASASMAAAQQSSGAASTQTRQSATAQSQRSAGSQNARAASASTQAIAANPEAFYGKSVRVTAPVDEIHDGKVVALDENHLRRGPDLLVLVESGVIATPAGNELTFTGTVRRFNEVQFDEDYDWFDAGWFDVAPLADWRGRPVIVAWSVQTPSGMTTQQQQQTRRTTTTQRTRGQQSGAARSQKVVGLSAGDIARNPSLYYGQKVRVTAEVEETLGGGVFTLDEDRLFAGPDVLVIAPGAVTSPREDTRATVTGTLRQFTSAEIRQDYDWFGYGWYGYDWEDYNEVWVEWNSRPVIIADSIQTEQGRELVMRQSGRQPSARRERNVVFRATPAEISQNPENYFGNSVTVRAEVADSYNPHAFTLDEDRLFVFQDLLVLVPNPDAEAPEGNFVTVRGVVRPFNRAYFQNESWFAPTLFPEDSDLDEWEAEKRPMIIAQSVRTDYGRELVQSSDSQRQEAVGGTRGGQSGERRGQTSRDQGQ